MIISGPDITQTPSAIPSTTSLGRKQLLERIDMIKRNTIILLSTLWILTPGHMNSKPVQNPNVLFFSPFSPLRYFRKVVASHWRR